MIFVSWAVLAAIWSAQVAGRRLSADFDWQVFPLDGYPVIAFEGGSETKEVVFKYNFTGEIGPNKLLTSQLLDRNCNETADSSLAILQLVSGHQMEIDLDIVQDGIAQSRQYSENLEGTRATIDFCLRVDYNYKDSSTDEVQSITFHETSVVISVDLTANFTLESISTNRTASSEDQDNTALDYPVEAYFCDAEGTEMAQPALKQGSALQFCVRTPDNVTADVYVDNILEFSISQPGSYPVTVPSSPIKDGKPDAMTALACELGVCNVKHQLSSKWFALPVPEPTPGSGGGIAISEPPSSMPSAVPPPPGGGVYYPPGWSFPPSTFPSSGPTVSPVASTGGGGGAEGGAEGGGGGTYYPPWWSFPPSTFPSASPSERPTVMWSNVPSLSPAEAPQYLRRELGGAPTPKPLRIDGVAVLALGAATASPTSAGGVRRLVVPLRGVFRADDGRATEGSAAHRDAERLLPEGSDPPFQLEVDLAVDPAPASAAARDRGRQRLLLLAFFTLLFAVALVCCLGSRRRRRKRLEEEEHHFRIKAAAFGEEASESPPGCSYQPPMPAVD